MPWMRISLESMAPNSMELALKYWFCVLCQARLNEVFLTQVVGGLYGTIAQNRH